MNRKQQEAERQRLVYSSAPSSSLLSYGYKNDQHEGEGEEEEEEEEEALTSHCRASVPPNVDTLTDCSGSYRHIHRNREKERVRVRVRGSYLNSE